MKSFILNENELDTLIKEIVLLLPNGGVIILQGDLASGKTTFAKAFAKFIGCDDEVTSPTFSLQQCYGENLFHYDIYNKGSDHFISLGMMEELERAGYHLLEWGDEKLINFLKLSAIEFVVVEILKLENKREYRVKNA